MARREYVYLGKRYPLAIRQNQKNIVELTDKLYIASANPKFVGQYLLRWYRQQARRVIAGRVQLYAKYAHLQFRSVSIGAAETRWGSCSSKKDLHFNWRLIMAPLEVVDYVVAHELAHIVELNHSRAFWEKVRTLFPLYRQYRTWLKRNGELLRLSAEP